MLRCRALQVGSGHEADAKGAGYVKVWDECYSPELPPNWKVWPDAAASRGMPFPKSADLLDFEWQEGANANYGNADTWYPSWAADGNLYTPWTDGSVNGVGSSSTGNGGAGYNSTTGHATLVGSDPFSLEVDNVSVVVASTFPYQGRYPCGTLVSQHQ